MGVKLAAASGGSIELVPTNTASAFTVTVPAVTATVLTDSAGILNIGSGQIYKDASGNVGIGTNSPTQGKLVVYTGVAGNLAYFTDGINTDFYIKTASGIATIGPNAGSTNLAFQTSGTERARIDSSGNLLVGATAAVSIEKMLVEYPGANKYGVVYNDTDTDTSGHAPIFFRRNGAGVGNISTTVTSTSYNTASDYRLKDNIAPMTGALAKVALLKPCTYKWKVDGSDGQGFIAHELDEVVPGCVTGEKDAVGEEQYEVTPAVKDEEGRVITAAVMGTRTVPSYQGIDTSFLVATLTAALQEQQALIVQLQADVAALKGAQP